MPVTTYLKTRSEMAQEPLLNCHDGNGALDWIRVLDEADPVLHGSQLRFIHDDILPPGATIGVHMHTDDEEYYYILSGQGVMILDGVRHTVHAGDITAVYPGGSHGLENISRDDLRILVLCVA